MPRLTAGTRSTASNRLAIQDMNSSLSFAGNTVASYVAAATPLAIGLSSDFTFGGWYKLQYKTQSGNADNHGLLTNNFSFGNVKGYTFQVTNTTGAFRIIAGATATASANNLFRYNIWKYLVFELTGTTFNVYMDDMTNPVAVLTGITRVADDVSTYTRFASESTGTTASERRITGNMKSLFATTTLLTSDQKTALMNGTSIPALSGVYYPLNEGAGSIAYDSSGNGNNGTITSGTYVLDTPTKIRKQVNGNLVYNGDFEYAPVVNAAQTSGVNRWIDGSAGGALDPAGRHFGWGTITMTGTVAAQYDTTVKYSGNASLKLSTTATGSVIYVRTSKGTSASDIQSPTVIPVLPSTSYTMTYRMKTNLVSGSASSGASGAISERNGGFATVLTTRGTAVTTTTDWTQYSITVTTGATTRFICPDLGVTGNDGAGTLIMDAWFDDIVLTPTTPITRTAVV